MKTILPSLVCAVALGCTAFAGPALAQNTTVSQVGLAQDDGARGRIAYSGKLSMLSQLVPAAACHLSANVDPQGMIEMLGSATAEFQTILHALEFGDAELNITGAETRRKTITEIETVRSAWSPVRVAAEAMIIGDVSDKNLQIILSQNLEVLEATKSLVIDILSHYTNPTDLVQADSFLIDIAGRQRLLIQMMSKESCMLSGNQLAPAAAAGLQGSMQTFSTSLDALRNGMPSAGIRRPPSAEIEAGLDEVLVQWADVKPILDTIAAGSDLDSESAARKFHDLNAMMDTMTEVVDMYRIATVR